MKGNHKPDFFSKKWGWHHQIWTEDSSSNTANVMWCYINLEASPVVMLYKYRGVTCCDAVDTDSWYDEHARTHTSVPTDHNMTGATSRPCYHLYGHVVSSNIQQQDFGIQILKNWATLSKEQQTKVQR